MKIRSVKFNAIMNFIYTAAALLFPLITFRYVSTVLQAENNGKLTFATSVINYLIMVASLGIPTYGIRVCAKVRDNVQKLSKTVQELLIINIITTVISFAAFLVLLFTVPKFMENKTLLIIMSINMLLNVVGVNWLYSALEQYTYITVRSLVFKILSIVLMFLLIKKPSDYILYGGITVFATSGANVLNFINVRKYVSLKPVYGKYDFKQHMKPIMIFFATSAASNIYTNFDSIILGFLQNDTELGYYTVTLKVRAVLATLVTSLGTVLFPRLSYYYQNKNYVEFKKAILKAFNFIVVFATAVAAYFVIFAQESVLFLSDETYLKATLSMMLLIPAIPFIGLANITGMQILTPMGQEKKVLISMIWGAGIDIVLNFALCPFFGAAGTAIAGFTAEVTVLAVQCWYLRGRLLRNIRSVKIWKTIVALSIACIAAIVFKHYISLSPFIMLCCSAVLFFGIYGMLLLLLKEEFVCSIIKGSLSKIRDKIQKK